MQSIENQLLSWFPINPKRKNEYRRTAEGTDGHNDGKEER